MNRVYTGEGARIAGPVNFGEWLKVAEESRYRASALSNALQVSPRQLRRYTRRMFGRSPQKWLNEQRLHPARRLLQDHRCVKAVAFELGFKQVSHFCREFKRLYGVTPSCFIQGNACPAPALLDGRNR